MKNPTVVRTALVLIAMILSASLFLGCSQSRSDYKSGIYWLEKENNWQMAVRSFNRAIEKDPKSWKINQKLIQAMAMGEEQTTALRDIGKLLAFLKEPEPPKGFKDALKTLPIYRKILDMAPKIVKNPPCQQQVFKGEEVDLSMLPIQTCWPGDAGPLITWGLVTTRGPHKDRQNMGIYRQQVIAKNKVIMRWLSHRGGALDYREWL